MFYPQNDFWTFHTDPIYKPTIILGSEYSHQTTLKTRNIRLGMRSKPTVVTNILCFAFIRL
jgi:hypothetical protein